MSLANGFYNVYFVDYSARPALLRPLGFKEGDSQLYILAPGAKPAQFAAAREQPGQWDKNYAIVTTSSFIAAEDDKVVASGNPDAAAYKWFVLRGAPSPPPMEQNGFAVFLSDEPGAKAWYPKSIPSPGDTESVQVVLGDSGFPWWFTPAKSD